MTDVCTRITVFRDPSCESGFYLYFYGLTVQDLMLIPNEYVGTAMRRRGLDVDGYGSSPFTVEEVRSTMPAREREDA